MLKAGIVGLPNVGKSTLFNALTRSHKAPAENYPFCTIDPNLGVVALPDPLLAQLAAVTRVVNQIPAAFEFVDIAGLVRGASQGEGLGNKFLSHIREVDALIQVVRCFEDPDIHHVSGNIDPIRDIEIISTELILADLDALRRRRDKINRDAKSGDKHALAESHTLDQIEPHLNSGRPAITLPLTREEWALAKHASLLTAKPTLFAANIRESDLATLETNPFVARTREYAQTHHGCETVAICAQLESDLADLTPAEAADYLKELHVAESGFDALIHAAYRLLGLRTFFTFNDKEVRAWPIRAGTTAAAAAGTIHSDFEKGFIKAEAVHWQYLVQCGSVAHARESGHYRIEGRDYEVRDGDVLLFKFHV
jgi:GTP-binding protein YchF